MLKPSGVHHPGLSALGMVPVRSYSSMSGEQSVWRGGPGSWLPPATPLCRCAQIVTVRWKEMPSIATSLRKDPGSGQKWAQGHLRQLSSSLRQK